MDWNRTRQTAMTLAAAMAWMTTAAIGARAVGQTYVDREPTTTTSPYWSERGAEPESSTNDGSPRWNSASRTTEAFDAPREYAPPNRAPRDDAPPADAGAVPVYSADARGGRTYANYAVESEPSREYRTAASRHEETAPAYESPHDGAPVNSPTSSSSRNAPTLPQDGRLRYEPSESGYDTASLPNRREAPARREPSQTWEGDAYPEYRDPRWDHRDVRRDAQRDTSGARFQQGEPAADETNRASREAMPAYVEPAAPEPVDFRWMLLRLVLGTALVLAACAISLHAAKRWLPGTAVGGAAAGPLRIIASMNLPQKSFVQLIEVDEQRVIIGGNANGLQSIVPLAVPFHDALRGAGDADEDGDESSEYGSDLFAAASRKKRTEPQPLRRAAALRLFGDDETDDSTPVVLARAR